MKERPTALGFLRDPATWCLLTGIAAVLFLIRGGFLTILVPYYFGILGGLSATSIVLGQHVLRLSSPSSTLSNAGKRAFIGLMLGYFSMVALGALYILTKLDERMMRNFH